MAMPALTVLVAAGKARQRQVEQPVLVLVDEAAVLLVDVEILAADDQRARRPLGGALEHGACGSASCGAMTAGRRRA